MTKHEESYPAPSAMQLKRMSGMEAVLEKTPMDLYGPVQYLLLLQEHGGFDALELKKVPSEVIGNIATDMGLSMSTLNGKRAEWNRDGKLSKARLILQPYFNEQFAMMLDYLEGAIPALGYRLIEKAMDKDAGYGIIKDALLTAISLTESRQKPPPESDASDDEYLENLKKLDAEN